MNVIIDTSIWSMALRVQKDTEETRRMRHELSELINEGRVVLLGVILQEILSGVKTVEDYNTLVEIFNAFDIELSNRKYYEKAAEFFNKCRRKGIQGSHIDFYICAYASVNNCQIFTKDNDFVNYSKIIDLNLYKCRF